uniref:Uncharacterized protein n=1 Tax=Panagrolaimus sp. ES5 TaxID=591445 RepID=A0AC34GH72_9BILA
MKVNKTLDWFEAKPKEERESILKEAMATAHTLEKDAAEDEKALGDAIWKRLLQQKEIDDKKAALKSRKDEDALNKVRPHGGIWKNSEQMNNILATLNATKKRGC